MPTHTVAEDVPSPVDAHFPLDHMMALTLEPLRRLQGSDSEKDDASADWLEAWRRTNMPKKTFLDLQWEDLIGHLLAGSVSAEGRLLVHALGPLEDPGAIARRMHEIFECQGLLEEDDAPPLRGIKDIRRAVAYARRGGVLNGEELAAVARNCDVAARVSGYFGARREQAPLQHQVAAQIDDCEALRQTLEHAVEPDGQLADHASADLGRLRRAVQTHQDRIRTQVDLFLKSEKAQVHLQDDYFTVREGRYVLPVRAGSQGEITGIVHGYSSSGQTAFVEPTEFIEVNNKLRWAQIELQEEIDRILARLSEMVGQFAAPLEASMDALAYLDFVCACARFGLQLHATIPALEGQLNLKQARHPLLWVKFAKKKSGLWVNDTVANDILLGQGQRVLVISGPNTGGKTVLLKTLGLCAMMARCGLTLPVEEGSTMPLYRAIFTDIGDEQSIERDLSTFSAHLENIHSFLEEAGGDSMVLLDELFAGTDPMQGAALGVALLEQLASQGATTMVTTHLESLKTLAFQREVYANASMGFDLEALAPTYRVTYGLPGSSYALRIASRLGFPDYVIDRAKRVLEGEDHQSVEEILGALEDKRTDLEAEQQRLEHSRRDLERTKQRYKDKYDSLLKREKELIHKQSRKLKAELDQAQDLIRQQIAQLQASGIQTETFNQKALEERREKLDAASKAVTKATDYTKPPQTTANGLVRVQSDDLHEGLAVYVEAFKRSGTVVEISKGNREALVQLGGLKVSVPTKDLHYTNETQRRAVSGGASRGRAVPESSPQGPRILPQTRDNTVDLRGMRADEAIEKVELFLDAVYGANLGGAYIIHGHGTGALKRAIRGFLPSSSYVQDWRRGDRTEGGDGVTVAFLKEHQ